MVRVGWGWEVSARWSHRFFVFVDVLPALYCVVTLLCIHQIVAYIEAVEGQMYLILLCFLQNISHCVKGFNGCICKIHRKQGMRSRNKWRRARNELYYFMLWDTAIIVCAFDVKYDTIARGNCFLEMIWCTQYDR